MSKVPFTLKYHEDRNKISKCWARVITDIDMSKKGVFKFVGNQWLYPDKQVMLERGSIVLSYFKYKEEDKPHVVTVLVAMPDTPYGRSIFDGCCLPSNGKHWLQDRFSDGDSIQDKLQAHISSELSRKPKPEPVPAGMNYIQAKHLAYQLFSYTLSAPKEDCEKIEKYLMLTLKRVREKITEE